MRFRTLWPAALIAAAVAAPVGISLAATGPAEDSGTTQLAAPALGQPSLRAAFAGDVGARSAFRQAGRARVAREHVRLARRYDALTGRHTARRAQARALRLSPARLRKLNRGLRADVRELDIPVPDVLERVAECESHGDPKAIGGGGTFRGRYQFMVSTWRSVGGHGDPAAAPAKEQDRRAAILLARSGSSPWPVCGA